LLTRINNNQRQKKSCWRGATKRHEHGHSVGLGHPEDRYLRILLKRPNQKRINQAFCWSTPTTRTSDKDVVDGQEQQSKAGEILLNRLNRKKESIESDSAGGTGRSGTPLVVDLGEVKIDRRAFRSIAPNRK
jgi:hypothetical protein